MAHYHARVAGTVGEHLHVVVKMGRNPAEGDALEGEASAPVRARVAQAQRTQRQRWEALNQDVEAEALREGALLSPGGERLLGTVQEKRHLSQRRTETVLRVARTIADLARSEQVGAEHVAEAVGYQRIDLDASCAERLPELQPGHAHRSRNVARTIGITTTSVGVPAHHHSMPCSSAITPTIANRCAKRHPNKK